MKFEKLQTGMTLYDVHSTKMGNTTISSVGVWPVQVIEVNAENRSILASWNGNKPVRMFEGRWSKLRLKEPELVRGPFGAMRIKPRNAINGNGPQS